MISDGSTNHTRLNRVSRTASGVPGEIVLRGVTHAEMAEAVDVRG
jgi:hypothetical protein